MKSYSTMMVFVLLFLSGCNVPWGLPEPTRKSVHSKDLVSVWQFETATMELREDKTFTMTGSRAFDGDGTWSIYTSDKSITLVYTSRVETLMIGYVIDAADDSFGIFGGLCGDPDCWQVMTKEE